MIALPLRSAACFADERGGRRSTTCADQVLPWAAAQNECARRASQLSIVDSPERSAAIAALVAAGAIAPPVWIGLHDRAVEGVFAWVDGQALGAHRPWYPGEPSGVGMMSSPENCVVAGFHEPQAWNDDDCLTGHGFVCDAVPRPHLALAANDRARVDVNGVTGLASIEGREAATVVPLPATGPWVIGVRVEADAITAALVLLVHTPSTTIGSRAGWRTFVPSTPGEEPPTGWTLPGFDDSSWAPAEEIGDTSIPAADLGEAARWITRPELPLVLFFRVEIDR
jgi:hypothetical protein